MGSYTSWLSGTQKTVAQRRARMEARAAHADNRINDKWEVTTTVAFKNAADTILAAQEVRIESDNRASMVSSVAGAAGKMNVVVYGIRDHATLPDCDIKEGYRFIYNGDEYRCSEVIDTLGERQGIFVAI